MSRYAQYICNKKICLREISFPICKHFLPHKEDGCSKTLGCTYSNDSICIRVNKPKQRKWDK